MTGKKSIGLYFRFGLVGVAVFLGFAFFILLIMRQLNVEVVAARRVTFWMVVYALGITLSVWIQFSVAAYFQLTGAFETTYFERELNFLERVIWPPLMILSAAFAISTVILHNPVWHLSALIFYLACAAGWDYAIWRLAKVRGRGGVRFKKRCGQLFRHIDGPALAVVIFWVLLVLIWQAVRADDWKFTTLTDMRVYLARGYTFENMTRDVVAHCHKLAEPLLAGVIGFHMLLTVLLMYIHMREWEDLGGVLAPPPVPSKPTAGS